MSETHNNLTPSRGPSVWGRAGWHGDTPAASQRFLIGAFGVGLVLAGWRRSHPAVAAAGAGLVALSAVEDGPARASAWVRRRLAGRGHDRVTDDSELSFPASDSPGWTATDSSLPR